MHNPQNSIPNWNQESKPHSPEEPQSSLLSKPKDILAALFFLAAAYYLYSWQPELKVSKHVENVDALPKIKEVLILMYLGLFASWFYRRVISKTN